MSSCYRIILTTTAKRDIADLGMAIVEIYKSPLTAKRYLLGLNKTILLLEYAANLFPNIPELYFIYGFDIRRLNYKKMAILYSIKDDKVFIHRILPQSMVIY